MSPGISVGVERVAGRKVGHFGCADGRGNARLVRVDYNGQRPPVAAQRIEVDCPVCGKRHPVTIAWRARVPADAGKAAEITL